MSKYYVVIKGIIPGIYRSWNDCKNQIHEYKGSVFKSFNDEKSAIMYYNEFNDTNNTYDFYIYTDGSFNDNKAGYAWVLADINKKILKLEYGSIKNDKLTNNVSELFAINKAIDYILTITNNKYSYLLYTDSLISLQTINSINSLVKSNGIEKAMQIECNRPNLDLYKSIITNLNNTKAKIRFEHVYGHKGDELNEYVDKYANIGRLS